MSLVRKISKNILLSANIAVVLLFIFSAFCYIFDPEEWPWLAITGIAFPFFLLANLLFVGWWMLVKKKLALISTAAILICGGAITNFFSFGNLHAFDANKPATSVRIATWNVARFIELIKNNNKGSQTRIKMLEQIKKENADILCLQEFTTSTNPGWYDNIAEFKENLGYPYYYYSHDWDGDRLYNGTIILSKLPIIDSGMMRYPRPTLPEALMYADIVKNGKIFRVYSTHLQSNRFKKEDISKIQELKKGNNIIDNFFQIFKKLEVAYEHRAIQTKAAKTAMSSSPHPTILCGDLNDIPNSFTYNELKGQMNDAFLQKSFGIGRTFNSLSPTLRIDYIFMDSKAFEPLQFKRIVNNYSDHYMLVADFLVK